MRTVPIQASGYDGYITDRETTIRIARGCTELDLIECNQGIKSIRWTYYSRPQRSQMFELVQSEDT
jgi:hypothetical protein